MSRSARVPAYRYAELARAAWTEADFQRHVIEAARVRGWLVHHARPARTTNGWRTPIEGDAGFPDLVLARAGVVILAELKSEKGRLTDHQRRWLKATGAELWRPSDWPRILDALEGNLGPLSDARTGHGRNGDASRFERRVRADRGSPSGPICSVCHGPGDRRRSSDDLA